MVTTPTCSNHRTVSFNESTCVQCNYVCLRCVGASALAMLKKCSLRLALLVKNYVKSRRLLRLQRGEYQ